MLPQRIAVTLLNLVRIVLGLGGFEEYGITYVAIEKNRDARRVVERNCDLFPFVTLVHVPKCSDAEHLRECQPKCHCGDLLSMRAHDKCGLNDGPMLLSYVESQFGGAGTVDLCVSGYPCKGHSSANRQVCTIRFCGHFFWHSPIAGIAAGACELQPRWADRS